MSAQEQGEVRVAALSDVDLPALAEFYQKGYGASASKAADGRFENPAEFPGCPFAASLPAPFAVVYVGQRIVGHLGSIPTQYWDGRSLAPAHWLKGFLVLEEYRNGPIGFLLAKQMQRSVGLSGIMVVAPTAIRLFGALGYKDMGAVGNYVAVIRPYRVLRALDVDRLGLGGLPAFLRTGLRATRLAPIAALAGLGIRAGLGALRLLPGLRAARLRLQLGTQLPQAEHIDALWEKMRAALEFVPDRSGAYLHWRYGQYADGRYQFVTVSRGTQLAALAVVRPPQRLDDPRLAGLRVASIVDLVVDPRDREAASAVLLGAQRWARREKCDAVLLTISNRDLGQIAKRLGYARISGNVHFLLRSPAGAIETPSSLDRTWLTRGDAWGDDI